MKTQKRIKQTLLVLVTVLTASFLTGGACDEAEKISDAACGECPTVAKGGVNFTGDARVDGLFKAIGSLKTSTGAIKGNFDLEIRSLADVFDVDVTGKTTAEAVALVKAKIEAEINANVEGGVAAGLNVNFQKPKCSANASLAVEASADCKVEAGCQAAANCKGPDVDIQCSGSCSGSCEGSCSGSLSCEATLTAEGKCEGECMGSCEGPSVQCAGTCSGTCSVNVTGKCDGACNGTCDGNTSDGATCAGTCEGTCEVSGEAKCEGTCNGSCDVTPGGCSATCKGECRVAVDATASCEGEAPKCEGKCEGTCSASCEGNVTPPSCDVDASCEAAADCNASASAQANASLECTPPSLEISYKLSATGAAAADAKVAAEFKAKMEAFKDSMIAIGLGTYKLKALVTGDAELGIQPPAAQITTQLTAVGNAIASGNLEIDIPVFRLTCATSALKEATTALNGIKSDVSATVQGQADMMAIIGIGGTK